MKHNCDDVAVASSTGGHLEGVVLREVVNDFQCLVVQLQV